MTTARLSRPDPSPTRDADELGKYLADPMLWRDLDNSFGVVAAPAVTLLRTMAPVLVWVREHDGIPIDEDRCRFALQMASLHALVTQRMFLARCSDTGVVTKVQVPGIPANLLLAVQGYLDELPGYDTRLPCVEQVAGMAVVQHGCVLFHVSRPHAGVPATAA